MKLSKTKTHDTTKHFSGEDIHKMYSVKLYLHEEFKKRVTD